MVEEGQVFYAHRGDDWVLRVLGPLRYTNANAVDRFLDSLFRDESPATVCIDLNATTAIDSTGIGLLAKVANRLEGTGRSQPILFSANPDINALLSSVCLDDVCSIVDALPVTLPMEPIPAARPTEAELAGTIAEAHRLLCELSADNRAQFRSVVEAFEREAGLPPRIEGGTHP